ncbi:MAG TPA: HAMP domain-containing sensor histidine kinase [Candidatus Binatia bacterium]|nr:HAMP domain-containing sensor histidine kinase [Candidatus Binatia bacterium]
MSDSFSPFAARLTRGYVLLAVALIVLVVATTSLLAFLLYVGALNEAIGTYAQRATERSAAYERAGEPLSAYAPKVANEIGGARVRVSVYDDAHRLLAQSARREAFAGDRITRAAAAFLGLHPTVVSVSGGTIVVAPDLAGFARLLQRYLTFVLPIGALAVVAAWLIGRAITRRAIAPLQDVSAALRRIAAGDFAPEPLLSRDSDLRELTAAYNEVAHRLTTATAERDRNEAQMRQFIADAGHELRTPLTIVMGYLEVLDQGVITDPDGVARVYTTMLAESRRMRASIDKLILLARLERPALPRPERIDAGAVARRAADALAPLAGPGRIALRAADAPMPIDADETELYEAIKNVVENALRYAPASGVTVNVASDGACVTIEVSDHGPGMAAQDVEHAFDRFYRGTSRTNGEGSGLGLAIAKRAVERAGGAVALESRLGDGTRVTMSFPSAPQPIPRGAG